MVPSAASGCAPNVMAQEPAPVADSVHLPARLTGGGAGTGPLGAAAVCTAARSLLQQPASRTVDNRIAKVAERVMRPASLADPLDRFRRAVLPAWNARAAVRSRLTFTRL